MRPVALLCTSNGVGVGHLSRVMGVAQRLETSFDVVILTLSAAARIPVDLGFRTEYFTSPKQGILEGRSWNMAFQRRLAFLHHLYKPSLLLFDGVHPYDGLCKFLAENGDVLGIWQRRGMWRPGSGREALRRARYFDLVIEPGDYAHAYDKGLTATVSLGVSRVNPVLFNPGRLSRSAAREHLNLEQEVPAALVNLGSGTIDDTTSLTRRTADLLIGAGVHVVLAQSLLAPKTQPAIAGVSVIQRYPLSDLFEAFDMAFLAGGYNSVHEALSSGIPSVFVANRETKMDDQAARTSFIQDRGYGYDFAVGGESPLENFVERLLDPVERGTIRDRCASLPSPDGADQIVNILMDAYARHR